MNTNNFKKDNDNDNSIDTEEINSVLKRLSDILNSADSTDTTSSKKTDDNSDLQHISENNSDTANEDASLDSSDIIDNNTNEENLENIVVKENTSHDTKDDTQSEEEPSVENLKISKDEDNTAVEDISDEEENQENAEIFSAILEIIDKQKAYKSEGDIDTIIENTPFVPVDKSETLEKSTATENDSESEMYEIGKILHLEEFEKTPTDKKETPTDNNAIFESTPAPETEESSSSLSDSPKETFVPINHYNPDNEEDEMFSKIFEDEKKEQKNRERDKKKWQNKSSGKLTFLSELYDWLEVIVLSTGFVMLLFTFVMRLAIVDGNSMLQTLHDGEMLIISDLMYEPENNDIIVFNSPNFSEPIVKRIIATEGQTVDIDFDTWTVTVWTSSTEKKVLNEYYVNKVEGAKMKKADVTFPVTVPEGYVFVMGDNRNDSLDSRNSTIGFVDERYILGEVKLRLFPFNKFGKVK